MQACETATAAGWRAQLALKFRQLDQRTVLAHSHQGPLRVQRPFYPEGEACHVYLVHPPAGVVGGDSLEIAVEADAGSTALVTTPGATQFYRSAGELAKVRQTLDLVGSRVDWLPQENIYFSGAEVEVDTRVSLDDRASFIGWDIHCFGRPAAAERFEAGRVCIKQRIERAGRPLLRERLLIAAPHHTDAASGLRSQSVCATLVATPVASAALDVLRETLAQQCRERGAEPVVLTLIDDLLIARYLGPSAQCARAAFNELWRALRPMVHQRPACAPRIWAT